MCGLRRRPTLEDVVEGEIGNALSDGLHGGSAGIDTENVASRIDAGDFRPARKERAGECDGIRTASSQNYRRRRPGTGSDQGVRNCVAPEPGRRQQLFVNAIRRGFYVQHWRHAAAIRFPPAHRSVWLAVALDFDHGNTVGKTGHDLHRRRRVGISAGATNSSGERFDFPPGAKVSDVMHDPHARVLEQQISLELAGGASEPLDGYGVVAEPGYDVGRLGSLRAQRNGSEKSEADGQGFYWHKGPCCGT